jgi:hypothetical protein
MIRVISKPISLAELSEEAQKVFGDMVKVVVDIDQEIIAINGELHADEEAVLLENGSRQHSLWGINLYPEFNHKKMQHTTLASGAWEKLSFIEQMANIGSEVERENEAVTGTASFCEVARVTSAYHSVSPNR